MTGKQNNILVVDDTPDNLRLLVNLLTRHDYKVRPASSGAYALATSQRERPDLILLDIMMPDMDGYEVCQQLKAGEATRDIPIIFISALNDVFDKTNAFAQGGVDYITKPFEEAEVLARVQTHLALCQLRQELEQKNQALQEANESLADKVRARTADLAQANESLKAEIEQRIRHQAEKDRLFDVVTQQSEQLRNLTHWLIETQGQERQGLATGLNREIEQNINLLQSNLRLAQTLLPPDDNHPAANHLENAMRVLQTMSDYVQQVTIGLHEAAAKAQDLSDQPRLKLTTREHEVLRLLAQGKPYPDIAAILTVTPSTVHTYISRIKQKLDIASLPGLIKFAVEHALIE